MAQHTSRADVGHEDRFLSEVHDHLADVPRRRRRDLLDLVAANLDERPAAHSWDDLVEHLGSPATYAAELRRERGVPARIGMLGRLAATRWTTRVALLVVLLAAVGFQVWDRQQANADPGLQNSCSGVLVDDPAVAVDVRDAGGVTERRMSYVDGATVRIGLCLTVRDEIELLGVDVPGAPISLYDQIGVRTSPANEPGPEGPVPLDRTPVEPDSAGLTVEVGLRLTDCEFYDAGGRNSFDTAEVRYRYRGRDRTETIDLHTTYSVVSPSDTSCPRSRAAAQAGG